MELFDFEKIIHNNEIETIQKMLDDGFDPNIDLFEGKTALHISAGLDNIAIVKLLLEHKAVPDTADNNGDTPLMLASFSGNREIIDLLINAGVDMNKRNKSGCSAAGWSLIGDLPEICDYLISKGAEDPYRRSILQVNIENGYFDGISRENIESEIIKFINQDNAGIDHQDMFGITPLMTASGMGLKDVVNSLVCLGADTDIVDIEGGDACLFAEEGGHVEICRLLRGE